MVKDRNKVEVLWIRVTEHLVYWNEETRRRHFSLAIVISRLIFIDDLRWFLTIHVWIVESLEKKGKRNENADCEKRSKKLVIVMIITTTTTTTTINMMMMMMMYDDDNDDNDNNDGHDDDNDDDDY